MTTKPNATPDELAVLKEIHTELAAVLIAAYERLNALPSAEAEVMADEVCKAQHIVHLNWCAMTWGSVT